jgi:hypothetical protein
MLKFFYKELHTIHPELGEIYTTYPLHWDRGYVQFENEWSQFFKPSRYNWISFRPIYLHLELSNWKYRYVELSIGFLGFGIYIQHSLNTEEETETLNKEIDDLLEEMKSRHICEKCGEVFSDAN